MIEDDLEGPRLHQVGGALDQHRDERDGDDLQGRGLYLDEPAWQDADLRTLCYQLDGSEAGDGARDYVLFIVFNADYRVRSIRIPEPPCGKIWHRVVDTSLDAGEDIADPGREVPIDPPAYYLASPRSTIVLVGK